MQEQISGSPAKTVEPPVPFRNNVVKDWSAKIEETGKFKIGVKDNAFSSIASRYAYIRILMNGFNALPQYAAVSYTDLFNPINCYANFQSLLNTVQVPADHEGFYLTNQKKAHLQSQFLSTP